MSSRSASAKPTEESRALETSTSQPRSPETPGSSTVDDQAKDESTDDTPQEDTEKNSDRTDRPIRTDTPSSSVTHSHGDWQAIWAPMQSAYYFYNSRTNETTWTNPLQSEFATERTDGGSTSYASASTSNATYATQAAAEAAGIDSSLAYLDPTLGLPGSTPAGTYAAKFNARTGAFTRMDARDPSHLSEAERAKRMSEVYFDVGAWEMELEQRHAEEAASGKKRRRPSKKDLEKFKEQKRLKKIAKTAWLRT